MLPLRGCSLQLVSEPIDFYFKLKVVWWRFDFKPYVICVIFFCKIDFFWHIDVVLDLPIC